MTITNNLLAQHSFTSEHKEVESDNSFFGGVKSFFGKVWESVTYPLTWMRQNAKNE